MELITTIPGGSILLVDDSEQATWEAENPASGDFLINTESAKLVYLSEAGTVEEVPFGGGGNEVNTLYVKNYTGTTYINTGLIGKPIVGFFLDTVIRYEVASSPDPGTDFTQNLTTGEIDIGTPFDSNNLVIQYKGSAIPPS